MDKNTYNRIAVVIASRGRPLELGRWVEHIQRQTLKPITMIWVVTSPDDLPFRNDTDSSLTFLRIIQSSPGLTVQRNVALELLSENIDDIDVIAFFDDDYVPCTTILEDITCCFRRWPEVAGLTGELLADGIHNAGITYNEAITLIVESERNKASRDTYVKEIYGLYGCNMAFRACFIENNRFDERLALYGWQEDIDFTRLMAKYGRICKTNEYFGVHQGIKSARASGKQLGFSQVVNPYYLYKKGHMPIGKMLKMMSKNFIVNHIRCFWPEPWIDRRGRVYGNWIGIKHLMNGEICPERVSEI